MSEDISSAIRVGVTVILVAALVAVVLNLMVVSQSILGSGLSTLQSGTNQVILQQFAKYDQKNVTGIEVKSAVTLYQGQDIAVIIRTNMCQDGGSNPWAWNYGALLEGASAPDGKTGSKITSSMSSDKKTGNSYYTKNLQIDATTGVIKHNSCTKNLTLTGSSEFILETAHFQSELIKDSTDTIVGILFTQIKS